MGTAGVASLLNWPTHNMPSGRWPQCWRPQIRVRCIIFMKPKNVNFQKIEFLQNPWISTSSDFVTWDSTLFSSIVPHYPPITHICVCIWLWGENSNQHLLSSKVPNNSCLLPLNSRHGTHWFTQESSMDPFYYKTILNKPLFIWKPFYTRALRRYWISLVSQ